MVSPGDDRSLAEAILELCRDDDRRRELGSNGFAYVSTNASCEAVGEKMNEVFKEVMDK